MLNPDTIEGSLLGDTGAADGISGLAFDSAGHLLASTLDGSFGSRTSRLLEIDPDSGSLIAEIGSITDGPGGTTISVGDLATQPATGSLFALRSGEDGLFQAGKLYTLEPATGVATLLGDTGTPGDGGLAFAPDGFLYTTRWDEAQGTGWLRLLDPTDGSALGEVSRSATASAP